MCVLEIMTNQTEKTRGTFKGEKKPALMSGIFRRKDRFPLKVKSKEIRSNPR
jgi:hypothetical protein